MTGILNLFGALLYLLLIECGYLPNPEKIIESRRSIDKGIVTIKSVVLSDSSNPANANSVHRFKISFAGKCLASESVDLPSGKQLKSLLGKDFLLYKDSDLPDESPQFRRLVAARAPDLPPGLSDPRLLGLRSDRFLGLGTQGFHDLIGREDIINKEYSGIIEDKIKMHTVTSTTASGLTLKEFYSYSDRQLVRITTHYLLKTGEPYESQLDISNGLFNNTLFPKHVDYKIIRDGAVKYSERTIIENADFKPKLSQDSLNLTWFGLQPGTKVFDRATGTYIKISGNVIPK